MARTELTPEAAIISAATAPRGMKKAVADAIGVTPGFVSQLASGRRPVPWDKAEALAREIGKNPEDISQEYAAMQRSGTLPPTHAGTSSHLVRLDESILSDAFKVIHGAAQYQGKGIPDISPRAIAIAYALLDDTRQRVDEQNLIPLVQAFLAKSKGESNESA